VNEPPLASDKRSLALAFGLAGIASHLIPELTMGLYAAFGRLQAVVLGVAGAPEWGSLAPPLGMLIGAFYGAVGLTALVLGVGIALWLVEMLRRPGGGQMPAPLTALYAPWPFRLVVQWGLVRGVCGILAILTDLCLLALPSAVLTGFGQLFAHFINWVVRSALPLPMTQLPLEQYAAIDPSMGYLWYFRDVLVGALAFAAWLHARRRFKGMLWFVVREELLPRYSMEFARSMRGGSRAP
jgi:hypothetical protein